MTDKSEVPKLIDTDLMLSKLIDANLILSNIINANYIQDKYDKRILARRYGNAFDCNNCGRNWLACKDDILEGYELDVKLRCPYCHNMISIPRNFNWL